MKFEITPLDLLLQQAHGLDDAGVLALGKQLDWQSPQTTLTRFDQRRQAEAVPVWPIECLIRSGSERVKALLLTPEVAPSYREMPNIQNWRMKEEYMEGLWRVGVQTAMATLDLTSLQTLFGFQPTDDLTHLLVWNIDRLPLTRLGFLKDPIQDEAQVQPILDYLSGFYKTKAQPMFWSGWKHIRSPKQRQQQMMHDLEGGFLNHAIFNRQYNWAEYWLERGATCNTTTLDLLFNAQQLPLIQKGLEKLRQNTTSQSNTYFIERMTFQSSRGNRDKDFSETVFAHARHAQYNIHQLTRQKKENWGGQSTDWIQPRIDEEQKYLDNLIFWVLEDGLAFPGFEGISKAEWAQAAQHWVQPSLVPNWLAQLDLHQVQPTAKELATLLGNDQLDILQGRLEQAIQYGWKTPGVLEALVPIYKENHQALDHEALKKLGRFWSTLETLNDKTMSLGHFAKKVELSGDDETFLRLQIQANQATPTSMKSPLRL